MKKEMCESMVLEFAFFAGFVSLATALVLVFWISKQKVKDKKMQDISDAIRIGSNAYLKRQYKTISVISLILAVILYFAFGLKTSLAFVVGAIMSLLAGYVSMDSCNQV